MKYFQSLAAIPWRGMSLSLLLFCIIGIDASAQDQNLNRIIRKLYNDQPAIGTFTREPRFDLDFVVIDAQYGEVNIDAIARTIADLNDGDGSPEAAPIVRTPLSARDAPEATAARLLEAGAYGLMFPDVETRLQAEAAMSAVGASPYGVWPEDPKGMLIAMIQIESPTAVKNLEAILTVPGIGVLFLGPTDMASTLGADGPDAPEVEALVQDVLAVCLERGIACGYPIVANSAEDAARQTELRLAQGFKVLAVMTRAE